MGAVRIKNRSGPILNNALSIDEHKVQR